MTKTTHQILSDAADLIEERGWCQESYVDDGGQCCALGAIALVVGFDPDDWDRWGYFGYYDPLGERAADALKVVIRGEYESEQSILIWNDHEGRTQAEVIAALREAAGRRLDREGPVLGNDE